MPYWQSASRVCFVTRGSVVISVFVTRLESGGLEAIDSVYYYLR